MLSKRQFERVAKVAEGFDQYMKDLYQRDEATIARDRQQRMDYRSSKKGKARRDVSSDDESGGDQDEEEDDSEEDRSRDKRKKSSKDKSEKSKGKSKAKARDSDDDDEDDSSSD